MGAFGKIVLAVDGSDASRRAVSTTRDLARASGGQVLVLHYLEQEELTRGIALDEAPAAARGIVESALAELRDAGVSAEGEVHTTLHGHVPQALLTRAASFSADVVVVGSRGLSDFSGLLVGSVAHKVIHLSSIPVLVVR